jgi:hypothetical protein
MLLFDDVHSGFALFKLCAKIPHATPLPVIFAPVALGPWAGHDAFSAVSASWRLRSNGD